MAASWLGRTVSRCASVETQRAGPVSHQDQEAAGDGEVLEKHDHLSLIGEVIVEGECSEQRKPGEQESDNSRLPTEDDGKRPEYFGGDDGGQQRARDTRRGHIGRGSAIRA